MRIKDKKKLIAVVLTVVVIVGAIVAVKWKDISSDADLSEISKQEETTSFDNPEDYDESDEGEVADYPGVTAEDEEIDVVSRFKEMNWDEMGTFVYGDYSMTQYAEDVSDMIETVYDFDSHELSFLDKKTGERFITVNKPNEKIQDVEWGYITDTVGLMQYEDMPRLLFEVKWDDEDIGANEFELVFIIAN